jgi:hypothetical protein
MGCGSSTPVEQPKKLNGATLYPGGILPGGTREMICVTDKEEPLVHFIVGITLPITLPLSVISAVGIVVVGTLLSTYALLTIQFRYFIEKRYIFWWRAFLYVTDPNSIRFYWWRRGYY